MIVNANSIASASASATSRPTRLFIATLLLAFTAAAQNASAEGKHLFILSGQSNMGGLDTVKYFNPHVEKAFGKENVICIKDAQGGQPIRRWYKKWQPGPASIKTSDKFKLGDLYDRLMGKVKPAIEGQSIKTVTFVWMQGEKDAREMHGEVYSDSFKGLIDQLGADLGRKDINFVLGRLSDFDMQNAKYKHWTMVRKAIVQTAEASPRGAWVDTDDLNDGKNKKGKDIKNDLHYSAKGYDTLGQRFAEAAIKLVKSQ